MERKTIIYLVGKQGSGKTKLVNAFQVAFEMESEEVKSHLVANADAGIFLEIFNQGFDYIIVTSREKESFLEATLIGVCKIFEFNFINAEILV